MGMGRGQGWGQDGQFVNRKHVIALLSSALSSKKRPRLHFHKIK